MAKSTPIENVHIIPLDHVKAYLLTCEKVVLVDTGFCPDDAETILKHLKKAGRKIKDVKLCLITHHHRDHLGALRKLKEICGFEVAAHAEAISEIEEKTGVKVDRTLRDGDTLPYCGEIKILHVPGHTKGNISIYLREKKTMIAGDSLFAEEGKLTPPPEIYCEDFKMAKENLRRLLYFDFEKILVSHGKDVCSKGKDKLKAIISKSETPTCE